MTTTSCTVPFGTSDKEITGEPTSHHATIPYAAAQFTTIDLPAYAEQALAGSGTFALAYGAKEVTDPRTELGLRADKS